LEEIDGNIRPLEQNGRVERGDKDRHVLLTGGVDGWSFIRGAGSCIGMSKVVSNEEEIKQGEWEKEAEGYSRIYKSERQTVRVTDIFRRIS